MGKWSHLLKESIVTGAVIVLVTFISVLLYGMGIRAETILMLYTFGILIIIMETKEYKYGIVASFLMVAIFNYFFTEPRYTLHVYDKNYFLSFIVFLIVSMIVTSLTVKIQKQMAELRKNQKITDTLYKISSGYLHVSGLKQVAEYGIQCLCNIQEREYIIWIQNEKEDKRICYGETTEAITDDILEAEEYCFHNAECCGKGMLEYTQIPYYLIPITSKNITYGVLGVECRKRHLKEEEKKVMEAVTSLIAIAVDREATAYTEQETRFFSEREKLRSNLLRSISHDLRTPLSGITGSAGFLLESWEQIDAESRNTLLKDISEDSVWLGRLVENLLNMTRIQEGRLDLNYQNEVVDDIAAEVRKRAVKRLGSRTFQIHTPPEYLAVPMDSQLIIQVLINLVDNAIKHTDENGTICLTIERYKADGESSAGYAKFAVCDDGTGIDEKVRKIMFDSFVTTDVKAADSGRGMGLGLSIAKEIIQVHGGTIQGCNNETQGATVYFLLPLERKEEHE